MFIVWIPGSFFKMEPDQRASVIHIDTTRKTLIVRSCGRPDEIAEVPVGHVKGIELNEQLTYKFSNANVNVRP